MEHRSPYSEGALVGFTAATVVGGWFILSDAAAGVPWQSLDTIGHAIRTGSGAFDRVIDTASLVTAGVVGIALWIVIGIAATAVVHHAVRHPSLRMGLWIGMLVLTFFLTFMTWALDNATDSPLDFTRAIFAVPLGMLTVGLLLWRGHRAIAREADVLPLGAEDSSPGAAPGGARPVRR